MYILIFTIYITMHTGNVVWGHYDTRQECLDAAHTERPQVQEQHPNAAIAGYCVKAPELGA